MARPASGAETAAMPSRPMGFSLDPSVESQQPLARDRGGRGVPRRQTLIGEEFTAEQISECKDLFSIFDKDGGGSIDRKEFGPMMRTLGLQLSERELDEFFGQIDIDGSGDIEFDELVIFLQRIAKPISVEEEMAEAFKFFIPDGGCITKKSLAMVLGSMGEDILEDECGDMISAATGGLDIIDFEAFQNFSRSSKRGHHARFREDSPAGADVHGGTNGGGRRR